MARRSPRWRALPHPPASLVGAALAALLGLSGLSVIGWLPAPTQGTVVAWAAAAAGTAMNPSHPADPGKDLSPALTQLAATAEQTMAKTQDLVASLTIGQRDPASGATTTITASLQMILPDVLRLAYLTPDFVAGQVLVLQQDVNDLRVYLPVTHQIMVQDLKKMMSAHGINIAVTLQNVISLPPLSLFVLGDEGTTTLPGIGTVRVVRATPRQAVDSLGFERIWVDPHTGFVRQVEMYDGQGSLLYSIKITSLKTNQGLTRAKLTALPKDAEIVTTD